MGALSYEAKMSTATRDTYVTRCPPAVCMHARCEESKGRAAEQPYCPKKMSEGVEQWIGQDEQSRSKEELLWSGNLISIAGNSRPPRICPDDIEKAARINQRTEAMPEVHGRLMDISCTSWSG